MAREGTFRADLYYRLTVLPITLPPLRDRREDGGLLAVYVVEKLRFKLGRQVTRIPDQAVADLLAYDWTGNVRVLEKIIERSMILPPGSTLLLDGLPHIMRLDFRSLPGDDRRRYAGIEALKIGFGGIA